MNDVSMSSLSPLPPGAWMLCPGLGPGDHRLENGCGLDLDGSWLASGFS